MYFCLILLSCYLTSHIVALCRLSFSLCVVCSCQATGSRYLFLFSVKVIHGFYGSLLGLYLKTFLFYVSLRSLLLLLSIFFLYYYFFLYTKRTGTAPSFDSSLFAIFSFHELRAKQKVTTKI